VVDLKTAKTLGLDVPLHLQLLHRLLAQTRHSATAI
jgi:hypothetical protein